ncbi:class I SAM-dependent methyltransferase [Palleronia sp.]|uniref:class I SAM-dependent methyltransferase n=1 Tax=Palleronia sp. TaxID=1940284 RepID=UPI0035C7B6FE
MWEQLFERILRSIVKDGTLELTLPSGRVMVTGEGAPHVKARITSDSRIAAVVRDPDLGTAEGYMNGEILVDGDKPEDEALRDFLGLVLDNMRKGNRHWSQDAVVRIGKHARRLSQFNPAPRAKQNVAHHYDLSAELYDIFLDGDRQYSCAYWPSDNITLEDAQLAKKRHIARKLLIEPGMRILDIGCGWGGMALTLAEEFGAEVVGVTLSEEQHKLGNERVKAKGLQDKIDIRLQDYRDVEGPFDRIVSVGMFEHVGQPHYDEYFRKCRELLKEDGVALIHTIGRTNPPGITSAFIRKYVFPGGYIPALSETSAAIERQGLVTSDLEVWRLHYAKTLRAWADRFEAGIEKARALYDERFCRMWRYYLVASEMSFVHGQQVVFQFQLSRTNDAVPITRDYLYN